MLGLRELRRVSRKRSRTAKEWVRRILVYIDTSNETKTVRDGNESEIKCIVKRKNVCDIQGNSLGKQLEMVVKEDGVSFARNANTETQ